MAWLIFPVSISLMISVVAKHKKGLFIIINKEKKATYSDVS